MDCFRDISIEILSEYLTVQAHHIQQLLLIPNRPRILHMVMQPNLSRSQRRPSLAKLLSCVVLQVVDIGLLQTEKVEDVVTLSETLFYLVH